MERIIITLDDDGTIDITAKSEGGDLETMEATELEEAVSIVRDLLLDAQEDQDMDESDSEMEETEEMDPEMSDEEYEKSWNEEASKRAKEREMQDSYT